MAAGASITISLLTTQERVELYNYYLHVIYTLICLWFQLFYQSSQTVHSDYPKICLTLI